jgi:hypothetical protein
MKKDIRHLGLTPTVIERLEREQEHDAIRARVQEVLDAYTKEGRIDVTIFQALELLKRASKFL